MKNKKGLLPLLFSLPILIVLGVILIIVLGFTTLSVYFLSKNAFTLLGITLAVIGAIGLIRGFSPQVGFTLVFTGIGLIVASYASATLGGMTLGVLLPP